MKFATVILLIISAMETHTTDAQFSRDTISTAKGDLVITFIGHGTLMFEFNNKVIHIDPVSQEADYTLLPKADIVLITHQHGDHFDLEALRKTIKPATKICLTPKCASEAGSFGNLVVFKNGDHQDIDGIHVEAVPAYNIVHMRSPGNPFHPKGEGNGYILTLGDKRVYVAGDTENTPEMKALENIDVAFLPMNLPYTMTPEMVADAAKSFKPAILYPYHYGNTNTGKLLDILGKSAETEIRIREMQ